jgi:hypothetical protein
MIKTRAILACVTGFGLALAVPAVVEATTTARPAAVAAVAAEIQSGHVTGIDLKRGLLFVDGQTYRIDAHQAAFSDDREKGGKSGVESLKRGDSVIVRSVRRNGERRVMQIVVKD